MFKKVVEKGIIWKLLFVIVFCYYWKQLIFGMFIMLVMYVLFYLMMNFMLMYGIKVVDLEIVFVVVQVVVEVMGKLFDLSVFVQQFYFGFGFGYMDFVLMQIIGVVFFGVFILLFGFIVDVIGCWKLLFWVMGFIIVFGFMFNFFLLLQVDLKFIGVLMQVFFVFGFVLMGMIFGLMGVLLFELFLMNVCYFGLVIVYNVLLILGVVVVLFIVVVLWVVVGGQFWLVGLYLLVMVVLIFVVLIFILEMKDYDYEEDFGFVFVVEFQVVQ